MRKTIQYGVTDEGFVISRVKSEIAVPVLDYEAMTPDNKYQMIYELERLCVYEQIHLGKIIWTRKIPENVKNFHRKFWGMAPLKGESHEQVL